MSLSQEGYNLDNFVVSDLIGRKVINSYGWIIGNVIGLTSNSHKGNSAFLGIQLHNGQFVKCAGSDVYLNPTSVILHNSWKSKADSLTNEVALISSKCMALTELYNDIKVPPYVIDTLLRKFEKEKTVLLEQRRNFSDALTERMVGIQSQLKEVYEFIACSKIGYSLGNIDDETYNRSYSNCQLTINRLLAEQDDIKYALNMLTTNSSIIPPEPLKSLTPLSPSVASTSLPPLPIKLLITE